MNFLNEKGIELTGSSATGLSASKDDDGYTLKLDGSIDKSVAVEKSPPVPSKNFEQINKTANKKIEEYTIELHDALKMLNTKPATIKALYDSMIIEFSSVKDKKYIEKIYPTPKSTEGMGRVAAAKAAAEEAKRKADEALKASTSRIVAKSEDTPSALEIILTKYDKVAKFIFKDKSVENMQKIDGKKKDIFFLLSLVNKLNIDESKFNSKMIINFEKNAEYVNKYLGLLAEMTGSASLTASDIVNVLEHKEDVIATINANIDAFISKKKEKESFAADYVAILDQSKRGDVISQIVKVSGENFNDISIGKILETFGKIQNFQTNLAKHKPITGSTLEDNQIRRIKDGRTFATKMTLMHLVTGEKYKHEMVVNTLNLCELLFGATSLDIKK